MTTLPLQVAPGPAHHGVALYAAQLAAELGAPFLGGPPEVIDDLAASTTARVHLHVTDRILGAGPAEAAARVAALCRRVPTTITLHDLPQAWDRVERHQAYATMARAAQASAVSSHHEADLLRAVLQRCPGPDLRAAPVVVHLPLVAPDAAPAAGSWAAAGGLPALAMVGFIYPDKGHRELVTAAAKLWADDRFVEVVCLGQAVPGHEDLIEELRERAGARGALRVTGHLADDELQAAMATVAVPVTGHRHLSASGSMNSWLAAGRRPLVLDGGYARELASLRPGAYRLYEDDGLADQAALALDDPATTWLEPEAALSPRLPDTARAYAAWWASVHRATAAPARAGRPVAPPMP